MVLINQQYDRAARMIREHFEATGRKPRSRGHYPMLMEREIIVIYGMLHGWSDTATARVAYCGKAAVQRRRRELTKYPELLFRCQILCRKMRGQKLYWCCELCGEMMTCSEREAREHVALHLVSEVPIALNGVGV